MTHRHTVGGTLTLDALTALHRPTPSADPRRHFHELSHAEQVDALRRMHADGASLYALAHCSGWSVEYIRRVLGDGAA